MRISVNLGTRELVSDPRFVSLLDALRSGACSVHILEPEELPSEESDMLLSVGGDGTFLSSSVMAADCLHWAVLP